MTTLQYHAVKLLPLIQALAAGKHVIRDVYGVSTRLAPIEDTDSGVKGTLSYLAENYDLYRIKPERAWKSHEVHALPTWAVLRNKDGDLFSIGMCEADGAFIISRIFRDRKISYGGLLDLGWEHSTDAGRTWQRCGVLEEGT